MKFLLILIMDSSWPSTTNYIIMPFVRVYLHFVWATKNRIPFLPTSEIRNQLWEHMQLNAKSKNIHLISVNGYNDHCHCLVSLQPEQMISKIAGLIKGESSFWVNKSGLLGHSLKGKFEWQDDYFVESVSPDSLYSVRQYIQTQEEHHRHISFSEEVEKFSLSTI